MKTRRVILSIVLCIVILGAGFAIMRHMVSNRPRPQRQVKPYSGPLVEVTTASRSKARVTVTATGTIQAARRAEIGPQVAGIVSRVAAGLDAGARFEKDALLFTIDDTDYRLAVRQADAAVARARSAITLLEGKIEVARLEWQRLHPGETPPSLVVYEPQLQEARASLAAAEAALDQARTNLARTMVRAPFTCRILQESVAEGEYVKSGNVLLTVVDAEQLEIQAPVELVNLQWITVDPEHGSPALAIKRLNGRRLTWPGRVSRLLADVDSKGRMARLVISLEKTGADFSIPPLVGMFVDLEIQGAELADIVVIPRRALRLNNTVWVVDADGELAIRPVHVLRLQGDEAWIDQGIDTGDRLVLTSLSGVANGMKVRIREAQP